MGNGRLEGMVALITGAGGGPNGGIGPSIARCFVREGARVAVNDLTAEQAAATVEELRSMGGEAWPVLGSVADPDQAAALVTETVEQFGQLDILVNNAGIMGAEVPVEEISIDQWLRVMGVDLNGPFFTSRAAVPVMRARGFGRIINISSGVALRSGPPNQEADYTTAKAGVLGLTRHLASEVTQFGITVNAILPGVTLTPLFQSQYPAERLRSVVSSISSKVAAQRLGKPEDVASLAAFLASREAEFISGAAIPVDGANAVLPGDFSRFAGGSRAAQP